MGKTEMMKRYEEEKKKDANDELYSGSVSLYLPTVDYIEWLEEKATAYDRLMSGKARMTMQEMANFIGRPITIGRDGGITAHGAMPRLETTQTGKFWYNEANEYMEINESFVDFSGDWKDSLTLPDEWEG